MKNSGTRPIFSHILSDDMSRHPLKIQPLTPGANVFYGHAVLDQLGLEMPLIDLLVRETIQNSLDAASGEGPVRVEFRIRTVPTNDVVGLLEGCGSLASDLPVECVLLEISDTGTTGLGGSTRMSSCASPRDFGQFIRLVYSMGVNQQTMGAGGSHGIGKSIYYHIGKGLAFFHSRIADPNSGPEHRLAACWVEDQLLPSGILQKVGEGSISTGVCWWGALGDEMDEKRPIEGSEECLPILGALHTPFRTSNGTSIIVPFLDLEKLDCRSIEQLQERIRESICRWYFPRMKGSKTSGLPILEAFVDGVEVEPSGAAISGLLQQVRNVALDGADSAGIQVRAVEVNGIEPEAGWLSWVQIPEGSAVPAEVDSGEGGHLLALVRKPGMVVRYHRADSWMSAGDAPSHVLAVFQSNPDARILLKGKSGELPLEEYLRACEAGNHHGWEHRHEVGEIHLGERQNFVNRIRKALRGILDPEVRKPRETLDSSPEFGRKLGRLLLPASFGRRAAPMTAQRSVGGKAGVQLPELRLQGIELDGSIAVVEFHLRIPPGCELDLEPQADLGGHWIGTAALKRLGDVAPPYVPLGLEVVSWRTQSQQGAAWKAVRRQGEALFLEDRAGQGILAIEPDLVGGWKLHGTDVSGGGIILVARMKLQVNDPRIRIGVGWRLHEGGGGK